MGKTLGQYLSDPKVQRIAKDAIRNRDLTQENVWDLPLEDLKPYFNGDLKKGFDRLYAAAESGDWYYPLYTEEECKEDPAKENVNLVWMPSGDPDADGRPFALVVPGGGFVNVWNLTEGWPVASEFNRLGYHVFILTYRVDAEKDLLRKNMEDFSRALNLIRDKAEHFHVTPDRYLTCGFSAGGYLVSLWDTEFGYPAYGLPKPVATFPVYAVLSLKKSIRYEAGDVTGALRLYGCDMKTAAETAFEIPEHVDLFPPCAIILSDKDELVNPENSKMLSRALKEKGIPCYLEIGESGGHGFADGSGMCMEGWIERALAWMNGLSKN